MNKKVILSMLVVASLSLTIGCSSEDTKGVETNVSDSSESNEEVNKDKDVEKGTDAEFIKDLEKSTQERWKITSRLKEESKEPDYELDENEQFDGMKSYIKAETDILYKYENSEFKDPKLGKLSTDYINGLKAQEKSLEYYYSDEEKWYDLWQEGYDKRSVSLLEMIDEYGVEADESMLVELRQNAQSVEEDKEIENKINEMVKTINFELEEDSGGWKEYTAVVENTTGIKFDHFDLDIKLVDKDGVIIDTPIAQTSNWNPEEKVRFSFGTDKTFDEMKWNWEYYNN